MRPREESLLIEKLLWLCMTCNSGQFLAKVWGEKNHIHNRVQAIRQFSRLAVCVCVARQKMDDQWIWSSCGLHARKSIDF